MLAVADKGGLPGARSSKEQPPVRIMAHNYFLPRGLGRRIPIPSWIMWRIEYGILALLLWVLRLLPLNLALRVGGSVVATFGPRTSHARKVRNNLKMVCPQNTVEETDQLVQDSFRHFGTAIAELARLDHIWEERDERIEFVLLPGATRPDPSHCTVFVSAHCGAWELTPLVGPYYGVEMPIIYATAKNPHVTDRLKNLRRILNSPLVPREGGIRVLMRLMNQGHSIGLAVDTRMDAGESLPFFGTNALTNTGPARLAQRYGCEMVPLLGQRLPHGRFRVNVFPPIRPRDTTATKPEQASDMSRQLNLLFESWIRANPGEWLCIKRRWPKFAYKSTH